MSRKHMSRKHKARAKSLKHTVTTTHGTVTVSVRLNSVRLNMLNVNQGERDLVFGIIELMNDWERQKCAAREDQEQQQQEHDSQITAGATSRLDSEDSEDETFAWDRQS